MDTRVDMDAGELWARVQRQLKTEFGTSTYNSWVRPMTLARENTRAVALGLPTAFMRDWVVTHYADRIRDLWAGADPMSRRLQFVVVADSAASGACPEAPGITGRDGDAAVDPPDGAAPDDANRDDTAHGRGGSRARPPATPASPWERAHPTLASAPLDPRYTFERFVIGKPNLFAHAAAKRVAESDHVPFNPLFLYGGVGLGKTHLMHAIAHHIRDGRPERRVAYLSAEKFMYSFIRALRQQDTISFKEQFRSVDVLMIDDVQFISGKESTQEEFFHTFNALVDQGRQIVLSADKSPNDLEEIGNRLRSRLAMGLVADIHPTTYELRLGILASKAEQLGVDVSPKVLEFIAHKIISNGREVEGALTRLVAHAQLVGRAITLDAAREVLHDLLRAHDRRVTIEEIQKKVAEHYNIRVSDMSSARRSRSVARPRQVAMYLSKQLTQRSLPEIGRKFGGRDHTTVMHAARKVEELCRTDSGFAEDVDLLRRMLES
ncbi:chromosomal replication initiator protein DnaA [Roseospira visakhapatnamensis]|uniref:Chromosomal replication initiator protein DnaA n=1 Tax=Roseospira visakhapatnamensis TaxID=390880 RepID=A0A7W6RFY1_9PROT|nr:chromosomal replication initiator protein DnaA [Roseospira visakhapatnamensis]MBB4267286.1 chromosomal replication initiator protein [Roseospira visakhapatnamensis]